jgi:hypothetical protein
MRRLKSVPLVFFLSLLLVLLTGDGLRLSPIQIASSPYRYNLVTWELSHLPDKWAHKLSSFLPWNSRSRLERRGDLLEYFRLGQEMLPLEEALAGRHTRGSPDGGNPGLLGPNGPGEAAVLEDRLSSLERRRSRLRAGVEETLESEVSAILAREGLDSRIGLIFPPVDVSLSSPPRVLVVSPRERIERTHTLLLRPDLRVADMEGLEDKVLREQDMAALVVGIGGVATYPTVIRGDMSLRHALSTAAHEWLHTFWFFRPLGWNISSSEDMNTLNETAADLAGAELGDRVYQALTGEEIEERRPVPPSRDAQPQDEARFDFDREMRKTRLRVDELLGQGKVREAEEYMEERRKLFVGNGFPIRKLNQAYFAFHGTYASNPASVSPIGGQVERVRGAAGSLGDFIRTMGGFGSYAEFLDHLSGLPNAEARRASPVPSAAPAS